jgi:hypothetical protein
MTLAVAVLVVERNEKTTLSLTRTTYSFYNKPEELLEYQSKLTNHDKSKQFQIIRLVRHSIECSSGIECSSNISTLVS